MPANNPEKKVSRACALLEEDCNYLLEFLSQNDTLNDITHQELLSRTKALNDLFQKLSEARELPINPSSQAANQIPVVLNKYHTTMSKASVAANQYTLLSNTSKVLGDNDAVSHTNHLNFKLPEIKLPSFDGDIINWQSFKDSFENLIINTEIPNSAKFHYLNGCLKAKAKLILLNLPTTGDNFSVAWELLKKRFDSPRVLVNKHLTTLLNPPDLKANSASSLQELIDFYQLHTNALRTIKAHADLGDLLLIGLITKGLPTEIIKQWEITLSNDELPKFDTLLAYLQLYQRSLEAIEEPTSQASEQCSKGKLNSSQPKVMNSQQLPKCPKCNSEHFLKDCSSFLKLNPKERYDFVSKNNRCVKCFRPKSPAHSCNLRCTICDKNHNKLLHFEQRAANQSTVINSTVSHSNAKGLIPNLIPTAQVSCVSATGKHIVFNSLLDSGSSVNLITSSAVKALKLQPIKSAVTISGVTSDVITSTHSVNVFIKSLNPSKPWVSIVNCVIVDKIPRVLEQNLNCESWNLPKYICFADPDFNCSKTIDLLLGSGFVFQILLPGKLIHNKPNYPVIQETELGWIVAGQLPRYEVSPMTCNFLQTSFDLPVQIKSFWEIEEVAPIKPLLHEEELAEKHFNNTYYRDSSGRYVVRLPTDDKVKLLGNSKFQAEKRLFSLERRFKKEPSLEAPYREFMQEYLALGHMQPAPSGTPENAYFVPHHPVIKTSSQTTPLRVVFDFSAKTTSGLSLNDTLLNGGKLQDDLFDILVRFRLYKIAVVADLAKMFRQVKVDDSDWCFQHILWRESPSLPIQDFVLNTVTYGCKPATFLAVRALRQLAEDEQFNFPLGSSILKSSFYVDDLLYSCSTVDSARQAIDELNQILAKGKFTLRKWASNVNETLAELPAHLLANSNVKTFASKDASSVNTLGVSWNTDLDILSLTLPDWLNFQTSRFTKRSMLSIIASVYDPLGFLAPCIIKCKILFQEVWNFPLQWDDALPTEIASAWLEIFQSLADIPLLNFPRCVLPSGASAVHLHGFCDSSLKAYGAVIYISHLNMQREYTPVLLCAKTKVVPSHMKDKNNDKLTIPRLELSAAVLLCKLVNRIITIFSNKITFDSINCWCDSRIVLDWLASPPLKGNVFAKNRAQYIIEMSRNFTWRYVNTSSNPADILSRGVKPKELVTIRSWWTGPEFLTQSSDLWPNNFVLKSENLTSVLQIRACSSSYLNQRICSHYGSFQRTIRVMALVLRFINFLKAAQYSRKRSRPLNLFKGVLSPEELTLAELACIKIVQQSVFPALWKALINNSDSPSDGGLISLNPFIDPNGCLRVGGRLSQASLPEDALHPLILPHHHHFISILIFDAHKRLLHANVQTLIVYLRQRFWIVSIRRAIKSVIRTCLVCFRHKPKPAQQIMADLPANRVTPAAPFQSVGVDYTGHFLIKFGVRGKARSKVYLALFVCFVTKAVHIEVVSSLTTQAFLMALKRFISRRGCPHIIYSDNSTTFVGANRKLDTLFHLLSSVAFQEEVIQFCSISRIKWKFIPPRSPHVGGIWEAGIKILKKHLLREMGDTAFTYEELLTVVAQIECILNSRPLIRPSDDSSEFNYLTPGHFLIGRPINMLPNPLATNIASAPSWHAYQKEMSLIWDRWSKEYLQTLQCRAKWRTASPNICVGTPVLVIEDNLPPFIWKIGVIVKTIPGRDNKVRTVVVKTNAGIITRHINRLCPLPGTTGFN